MADDRRYRNLFGLFRPARSPDLAAGRWIAAYRLTQASLEIRTLHPDMGSGAVGLSFRVARAAATATEHIDDMGPVNLQLLPSGRIRPLFR
jgi:hypothetical protein